MIVGLFGDVGSGKTINAIKFIVDTFKDHYTIYSNIALNGIKYTPLTLDMLLDIVENGSTNTDPTIYFIDEIILFGLDSRTGASKISRILSYFLLEHRKLGSDSKDKSGDIGTYLIYTTQFPDLIDKRLWITTTIKISHHKYKTDNETYIFRYWYIRKIFKVVTFMDYFIADPYFEYYNTKEIVRISKTNRYSKPIIKEHTLTEFENDNL